MGGNDGLRHGHRGSLIAGAALAAVVLLLLHDSLLFGKILSQADALGMFEPWASVVQKGFVPSNPLLLDQATGFLPWLEFQSAELRRGELPLWNPYCYCGEPFGSLYQTALFSPFNWIYYLFPSWHTHAWIAFVKLWLAGQLTFLFLRRLGLHAGAAATGGLAFMLCGFMVAWLGFNHTSSALFLPGLLWSVERMAARPCGREGALFGALTGLHLLAGHAQTSLLLVLASGSYALLRTGLPLGAGRLSGRGLLWLLCGGGLGVLVSGPQLLPFLEFLPRTQAKRFFGAGDLVANDGVAGAAIMMLDPFHFGAPHTNDYTGPLGPNLNFNELIGGYVGRVVLALALIQVCWWSWRTRRVAATAMFLGLAVVGALVAYQIEPLYGLLRSLPVLASTKLMRFSLFLAFGLACLAALALDSCARGPRARVVASVAAFVLVAAELLAFARGYNPEVDRAAVVPRTAVTDWLKREVGSHRVLGLHNTYLRPNANMFYGIPMISGYNSMEDSRYAELLLRATRVPPRFPFVSEILSFDRIEALPLLSLLGAKFVLSKAPLPEPFRKVLDAELTVYENPAAMPGAFLAKDVRVVTAAGERVEQMTGPAFDPGVAIVEADSEPLSLLRSDPLGERAAWRERFGTDGRVPAGPARADVVSRQPRAIGIEVESARRELLVMNDVWDPGWSAEVRPLGAAGTAALEVPIERVDHALRGIWIEPGSWTVDLAYRPASVRIGIALALAGVVALAALALLLRPLRSS